MRTKYPVRYLTKHREKLMGIALNVYPNAGPNPSVVGMRNLFWGQDAFLVRQGQYVYKVPSEVYYSV